MNNQLTPCYVSEMPGEKVRALLFGFFQDTFVHFAGGKTSECPCPAAVVMFETGDVRCVRPGSVQIINAEGIFSEYAFPKDDGATSPI